MPSVELTDQEWQYVLAVLSDKPWREVHTLVMKIGGQLQAQATVKERPPDIRLDSNGKEARHE